MLAPSTVLDVCRVELRARHRLEDVDLFSDVRSLTPLEYYGSPEAVAALDPMVAIRNATPKYKVLFPLASASSLSSSSNESQSDAMPTNSTCTVIDSKSTSSTSPAKKNESSTTTTTTETTGTIASTTSTTTIDSHETSDSFRCSQGWAGQFTHFLVILSILLFY